MFERSTPARCPRTILDGEFKVAMGGKNWIEPTRYSWFDLDPSFALDDLALVVGEVAISCGIEVFDERAHRTAIIGEVMRRGSKVAHGAARLR